MKKITALVLALLLTLSLWGCNLPEPGELTPATNRNEAPEQNPGETEPTVFATEDETLQVHFLDVGQADCALLYTQGHAMLIDAGNVEDSSLIVSYLLDLGIQELDCVVATHAHEDHAGGMAGILAVFPVETVYVTTTTYASQCYDDFMHYVDQQRLEPRIPSPGDTYALGDATVTFLGPIKSYAETNDTSLVCRVDYGDRSFLFTGDMELEAEGDLLEAGANLQADVLKLGHHGSSTSTGPEFFARVNPDWGIISCGAGNTYGHPNQETLDLLAATQTPYYRTDEVGTVIATTDGETIVFTTDTGADATQGQEPSQEGYIGNKNSLVFHLPTCTGLPAEKNQVALESWEQAVEAGYTPCSRCLGEN